MTRQSRVRNSCCKLCAAEKALLREALAYAKTLLLREGYEKLRLEMEKRLERLESK